MGPGGRALPDFLRLDDVRKRFGGIRAVDGVTTSVREGELVGLIGPNGSGKSTLFNVITGVYAPDAGSITFRGDRVDTLDPWEIFAKGVVRSFQNPRLFRGMTVIENALVPPREQAGERLVNAPIPKRWEAQEVTLTEDALETLARNQLDAVRLNWATEVSGGQMKLLEVSRATMGRPRLLLLDEPTAGVASKLAEEIFQTIVRLREEHGLTFVVIEHRLEVLFDYVERVLVMHQGKILFDGKPEAAVEDEAVVDAYLGEGYGARPAGPRHRRRIRKGGRRPRRLDGTPPERTRRPRRAEREREEHVPQVRLWPRDPLRRPRVPRWDGHHVPRARGEIGPGHPVRSPGRQYVSGPSRARESGDGGVLGARRAGNPAADAGSLRPLPRARRTKGAARGHAEWRGATDARDRAGAHGPSAGSPARRADGGPRAENGRGTVPPNPRSPGLRRRGPPDRATREEGARNRRPRSGPRRRPEGDGRHGPRDLGERELEGGFPRAPMTNTFAHLSSGRG